MALLSVENLYIGDGRKPLISNLNLQLDSGEMVCIYGSSGAGKSLIAGALAGLPMAHTGRIDVTQNGQRAGISVGLQNGGAAGELTVYENLTAFAQLWGLPGRFCSKRVAFLVELLKLGDVRNLAARELSAGQAARLEIARALLPQCSVYCFDSLMDCLDQDILEHLWRHLQEMCSQEGVGVLITSAQANIARMCPKIAVLVSGRVIFCGDPEHYRRSAGDDLVVIGNIPSPAVKRQIKERLALTAKEEDGYLSFEVGSAERAVHELFEEYGSDIGGIYVKRPTLEDALEMSGGVASLTPEETPER